MASNVIWIFSDQRKIIDKIELNFKPDMNFIAKIYNP